MTYTLYILAVLLLAVVAVFVGMWIKAGRTGADDEYMSRYSDRKRLEKELPVMLRKQAD